MNILVIGCGHIGKKHAINIQELGHSVSIYDTDPEVMAWCIQNKFEWVEDLEGKYDGAVIATPPEFHYQNMADCIKREIRHLLVEKPLGLKSTFGFNRPDVTIMMAHNYLFSPKLFFFKREVIALLRSNRNWEYVSLDYLPNWHGVDFANQYEDRHEAKDGCMAVSMPHAIYILDFLFGMPDKEEYFKSNYDIINTKGDNAVSGVRENATSKVTILESWIAKEGGRKHFLVDPITGKGFDWTKVREDLLDSYKIMMKRFLDVIEGVRDIPELCRLEEGIRIVKAIEESTYLENPYE